MGSPWLAWVLSFGLLLGLAQGALGSTHTVAPGETLFAIARRYGTTVEELARLNGLRDPNRIRVGQVLLVRPSVEVALPKGKLVYSPPVQGRAMGLGWRGIAGAGRSFWGCVLPWSPGERASRPFCRWEPWWSRVSTRCASAWRGRRWSWPSG